MSKIYITEEEFNEYWQAAAENSGFSMNDNVVQYARNLKDFINRVYEEGFDKGFKECAIQLTKVIDSEKAQVNRNA